MRCSTDVSYVAFAIKLCMHNKFPSEMVRMGGEWRMVIGDRLDLDHLSLVTCVFLWACPYPRAIPARVGCSAVAGLVRASGCGTAGASFGRLLVAHIRTVLPAPGCRYAPSRGPRVYGYVPAICGYSRISQPRRSSVGDKLSPTEPLRPACVLGLSLGSRADRSTIRSQRTTTFCGFRRVADRKRVEEGSRALMICI
jgi:hypothetical protein